jgi:hypothetical protein
VAPTWRDPRLTQGASHDVLRLDMSNNLKDRSRVNVSDAADVTYWCEKFSCSQTQLRTAVKIVGVTVSKVRAHLAQRR